VFGISSVKMKIAVNTPYEIQYFDTGEHFVIIVLTVEFMDYLLHCRVHSGHSIHFSLSL
jgi:hypothetical protein